MSRFGDLGVGEAAGDQAQHLGFSSDCSRNPRPADPVRGGARPRRHRVPVAPASARGRCGSKRALKMLDPDQLAARIEADADCVEAQFRGTWSFRPLDQPQSSHLPHS
jgi:hypothetical protein